jgi:uncharacterized heparinase superfamily protein
MAKNTGDKDTFSFMNNNKQFSGGTVDWRCFEMPKLWRYNLHYFDYLLDAGRPLEDRCRLIDDWIAENPVSAPYAWEPFPVSLRIVNWVKFFLSEGKNQVKPAWLKSLYHQVLWLDRNIEYHLLGNHFFKNAKALLFAEVFFEDSDAERWLRKGIEILTAELNEQIMQDGGHFERSPMYHSMILEDCLDLINVLKYRNESKLRGITEKLEDAADRMVAFLGGLCHPDEQIALFNDAAFGIEMPPQNLFKYYEDLTNKMVSTPKGPLLSYPDTGYYVMSADSGNRMLIDCGPIGPDYQPGHSHCDTLSFELSLKGRRVIVDSGCSQYEDSEIRKYNRGNRGHNTIMIDGENQSEVWSSHRCARRAKPLYAELDRQSDGTLFFKGAHDGYRRLKGRPIHHRSVKWLNDTILIEDRIEGHGRHDIESRLHIHPDLQVVPDENRVEIKDNDQTYLTISLAGMGRIEVVEGWYCPEFGLKHKCAVVKADYKNESLPFKTGWELALH